MRVFTDGSGSWDQKANFVDRNNTLVGYDLGQSCCVTADWTIGERPAAHMRDGRQEWPVEYLEPYAFAVDSEPVRSSISREDLDAGDSIAFRLVAEGEPDLWLTLFNSHNGYYSHGFTVDVGGKRAIEGLL